MILIPFSNHQHVLFATKEKALVDLFILRTGRFSSKKQFNETLFDDMRIEEEDMDDLNLDLLKNIEKIHWHIAIR